MLKLNTNSFTLFAALSGFLTVILGAFAAHGLKGSLSSYELDIWKTAVLYQFVHTIVILQVSQMKTSTLLIRSQLWFSVGILLFSGSLYLLAVTGVTKLGMFTPLGGICFLLGWIYLIVQVVKNK